MTDPKYIADRDKLAEQYADSVEQDWTGCSHNAFFVEDTFRLAFDAGYSRANSELRQALDVTVEALRIYAIDINGHKARETLTKIKTLIGESGE
jgi:hypothetical protein